MLKSPRLEVSQDELDKIAIIRARKESTKVDENWLFVAEFGYYFGWEGIRAIRGMGCQVHDKENSGGLPCQCISMEEANMLLSGARKVWSSKLYDQSLSMFIGAGAAQSKKPNQVFKRATRDMIKHSRPDS